jgi:hypothetical protein
LSWVSALLGDNDPHMDERDIVYKGIGIKLRPTELRQGGWTADFTLN